MKKVYESAIIHILMIEESKNDASKIIDILKNENYKITVIDEKESALKIIEEDFIDLILLDNNETRFDSIEFCQLLKSDVKFKDIPVIIIRSKYNPEEVANCFKAGAIDYIIKPFNSIELLARVHTYIYLKRVRDYEKALNKELNNRNRDLEQIIHTITHDLRNPMTNIQGFTAEMHNSIKKILDLLRNTFLSKDVKKEIDKIVNNEISIYKNFIQTSITNMDLLLSGLLRLTRLGRVALSIESINVNSLVNELLSTKEFQIKENNIKIELTILPDCKGDSVQINQVFANLIDNAIKYLDPEKESYIKISGKVNSHSVIYCIEDNGIGIEEKNLEKIFDLFHRVNPNYAKGEGLGLTIVKKIIEMHKGDIWIESEFGKWSKFYFSLPLNLK